MTKKIKPNLLNLGPNTDSSAMLRALGKDNEVPPAVGTQQAPIATAPGALATSASINPASGPDVSDGRPMVAVGLVVGSTYSLPLSMLAKSDNNARVFYNPNEVDEMAADLRENGQRVPAVGYVKGDTVVIVDGQKRFNAAALSKISSLKVVLCDAPATAAEEYEASRSINVQRSTQTAFDDAVRWQDLVSRGEYKNQEELAQRLGVSPATVSKTLGINRIPQHLRRMMAENPQTASLTIAYEISNIFSSATAENIEKLEAIAEEVANAVIKKGLGREQTIELVRSKIDGPKQRVRGDTIPVKFGSTKGTVKTVLSRGEFTMSFRGLKEAEIEDLKRRVESVLAGQMPI